MTSGTKVTPFGPRAASAAGGFLPKTKLVLASSNAGKLRELTALLAPLGLDLVAQSALGIEAPRETGVTFAANALLKARHAARAAKLAALADDSGLEVDALGGRPGVHSARFAGEGASDLANLQKLLAELHDVPAERRQARYQCVIVLARDAGDPDPIIAHGTWEGHIAAEPRGAGGFGYDPIFVPVAMQCTSAELAPEQKNAVSHRAQALRALVALLRQAGLSGPKPPPVPADSRRPLASDAQSVRMKRGKLFVIAAPSGAGKTSLVKALLERRPQLHVSVSHTTRPRRPTEVHGREYYFVTEPEFQQLVDRGQFLEHARVFDNHYGTARAPVETQLAQGSSVVLEIDWQGARQVRDAMPECSTIFVLPPSRRALEERLRQRATDSDAVIARRLRDAVSDMTHWHEFDYVIVNEDFEKAVADLVRIVDGRGEDLEAQRPQLQALLAELLG